MCAVSALTQDSSAALRNLAVEYCSTACLSGNLRALALVCNLICDCDASVRKKARRTITNACKNDLEIISAMRSWVISKRIRMNSQEHKALMSLLNALETNYVARPFGDAHEVEEHYKRKDDEGRLSLREYH